MGKAARRFLSAGMVLLSTFCFSAVLLAALSWAGSPLPWQPFVSGGFSVMARATVLLFLLSYIIDYLTRKPSEYN